ncbi:MAG: fructose-6-phosphate aldolase [Patescibacteria group bacterium]
MQIFLDSAELDLIKKYVSWGVVDGVTTNPSLILKSGADLKSRILEICELVPGPVSCEVVAEDVTGMVEQGRLFSKWADNIFVKIPITSNGLEAVKILSQEGIHTNVTLIFNAMQALLAAKAGATLVSPFVGRLEDIGQDGISLVEEIVNIFGLYNIETKVLSASLRTTKHVLDSARAGADIVTIPPQLLDQLLVHPLTKSGLEKFMEDAKKTGVNF